MDFDASRHGDKTEHIVAVNGMAATGHLELYAFEIAVVDHQHVFLLRHDGRCGVGQIEGFGTSHLGAFGHTGFALL